MSDDTSAPVWSEMTPVERDAFIHEKVMRHDPAIPCDGTFIPNPHDGSETLYCPTCGACVFFGDPKIHETPFVPAYTTDMTAAWSVVLAQKVIACNMTYADLHEDDQDGEANFHLCSLQWMNGDNQVMVSQSSARSMPEVINKAVLAMCGVEVVLE